MISARNRRSVLGTDDQCKGQVSVLETDDQCKGQMISTRDR